MMNKQKSKKAWQWKAAAFLPMLALLLMAFGRTETVTTVVTVDKTDKVNQINEVPDSEITKSNKFLILVETTDNGIKLTSRQGCAFKELTFTLKDNAKQAVDQHGMSLLNRDKTKKDDNLADFLFVIKKTKEGLSFEGIEGTVWKNLSFNCPGNKCHQYIDQNGMTEVTVLKTDSVSQINEFQESKGGIVKGKVILPDGKPLREITVNIKGTNIATRTDENGFFELKAISKGAELQVYHPGMQILIINPDFGKVMVIKMSPGTYFLDRVKVVGNLGDLNSPPALPHKNMFNPGNRANPPLYIVDGVIADDKLLGQIEPDDLASINVLKDKSATDKYGEKAKYGALEITTKKKISIPSVTKLDNVEVPEYADNQKIVALDPVYNVVDVMPEFDGGMNAFMRFIADNIKYPVMAKSDKVQGNVDVNFFISSAGKVENVNVKKEINPELVAEAIRVVSSMPDWKPGQLRGKGVEVEYTIPIQFILK